MKRTDRWHATTANLVRATCLLLLTGGGLSSQSSVDKAEFCYDHGLTEDAKRAAIDVLFSCEPTAAETNAAKMLLARIARDEGRVDDAIELWRSVAGQHPKIGVTKTATRLLKQFGSAIHAPARVRVRGAVAEGYMSAAEFWLPHLQRFVIDSTWLGKEEAAVFWLDQIVAEFPDSAAAEHALASRVRAYVGVNGDLRSGQGGSGALGILSKINAAKTDQLRPEFDRFMRKAGIALGDLEKSFPDCPKLQRLRFMLARAYRAADDSDNAEAWIKSMVNASGGVVTFWSHLARLRLEHWRGPRRGTK